MIPIKKSPLLSSFLSRKVYFPRNNRGVALLMAVSALALITYLAMQVMYESSVEYTVNSQSLSRLKAYYAAKSGMEVSLLRVKIYQTVMNKYGKQLGPYAQYVDQIWQFPFAWPLNLPTEMDTNDKEAADKLAKESTMDAAFATDIQDEGSKIDLNDLDSPSKTLKESARNRLLDLFKHKVEEDEEFRAKYGNFRFEELVNNIADWMRDSPDSLNGGDKKSKYAELNKDGTDYYPPNRAFRTVAEVRLVPGMNDDFYEILGPNITIFGMRGINPNVASKDVIKSLDPGIDDRVADEIIKRREDPQRGPFSSAEDFWTFVQNPPAAARLRNEKYKEIPIVTDSIMSFRIKSTGSYGNVTREIVAIVTDLDRTASKIKEFVDKDKKPENPDDPKNPPPKEDPAKQQANNPLPKGPPRTVYWSER